MNGLYPVQFRAKNVAVYFMAGLSVGGLAPALSGYLVQEGQFALMPAFLISLIALLTYAILFKLESTKVYL